MRAFLWSCALSSPLIVLYHILTRFQWTAHLIVILYFGIGAFAGAMYGLYAHQRGKDPTIPRLITGGVVSGFVVATAQFAVALPPWSYDFFAPMVGGVFGGVGAVLYLAMQRAGHGKEDAAREKRFQMMIEQRGARSINSEGERADD